MEETPTPAELINSGTRIFDSYKKSKYLSIKHDSYFQVYDRAFSRYVGQPITFVEIGILSGGSLFMWRNYFGPSARIIGIDLNPNAKKWEKDGFEIIIGDQSDSLFWDRFYQEIGPVDIVLDDGGHSNKQQIISAHKAINNIRDGGVLLVEDVHASYLSSFGNPSPYSFVNFARKMVDSLNSRFPKVKVVKNDYGKKVFSIEFYESIVVFNIDSRRCFDSNPTSNDGIYDPVADDKRDENSAVSPLRALTRTIRGSIPQIDAFPVIKRPIQAVIRFLRFQLLKSESRKQKKYFD